MQTQEPRQWFIVCCVTGVIWHDESVPMKGMLQQKALTVCQMIISLHPIQDDLQEKGWNKKRSPSSSSSSCIGDVTEVFLKSRACDWSHFSLSALWVVPWERGGFDYYGLNFWLRFNMALSMQKGMEFPLSARCECHNAHAVMMTWARKH